MKKQEKVRLCQQILIPELNRIVFGFSSWWKKIDSTDDFSDITPETIQNVWYVKLLKDRINEDCE